MASGVMLPMVDRDATKVCHTKVPKKHYWRILRTMRV